MSAIISTLSEKGVLNAPPWLKDNVMFESMAGSVAYGVSTEESDHDYISWCIPPKDNVFYENEIPGFGKPKDRFQQYQQQHVEYNGKVYDVVCHSIVKYFNLCMENNPNMVETLFYPVDVITHSTMVSNLVRDNRKLFLHKGAFFKMKAYAYSQMSKALSVQKDPLVQKIRKFETDNNIPHSTKFDTVTKDLSKIEYGLELELNLPESVLKEYYNMYAAGMNVSKRFQNQKEHFADTKFLYHLARLVCYCRQILEDQDLDVRKDREYWKAIRRGEVSTEEIKVKFEEEERALQKLYDSSKLRAYPDQERIYELLLSCLESHYGKIPVAKPNEYKNALQDIAEVLNRIKIY